MTEQKRATIFHQAESAFREGDLDRASAKCLRILEALPKDVQAREILSTIYLKTGKPQEAILECKRVLHYQPTSKIGMSNLTSSLRMVGSPMEAAQVAMELMQLAPDEPSGYVHMGLALIDLNQLDKAILNLAYALQKRPDIPIAHMALGSAFLEVGRLEEAEKAFEFVLNLTPDDARALSSLAKVRAALDKREEAQQALDRLKATTPDNASSKLALVSVLNEMYDSEAAERTLAEVVSESPRNLEALILLGLRLQETGRFEESRPLFRKGLELKPHHGMAFWGLVQGRKMTASDISLLQEMESALQDRSLSLEDQKYIHYALGKSFDDLGQYESAMTHFKAANSFSERVNQGQKPFSGDHYSQVFDRTIDLYSQEFLERSAGLGNPSDQPIFIVGMMRSGTSLVEQILSSHSRVGGAGELDFWHKKWHLTVDYPNREFRPETSQMLTKQYLALLNRLSPNSDRVTDKLPQNSLHLGALHTLFPNAKIILCKRNPVDTCLSIYTNPYRISPDYAHRPENLVKFYREHERLMSHWKKVIPSRALTELVYEDLVRDQEDVTRNLLEFCGLDWEEACLHHEKNRRSVLTTSVWQVRQPKYATSVDRWKHYKPWLGDLADLQPPQ